MQNIFWFFKNIVYPALPAAVVAAVLICFSCTAEGAWDLLQKQKEIEDEIRNWEKRIKLTINNSAQGETLSDFPVLVKLNAGNISYSDLKPDGSDLVFYTSALDDWLDFEIDTWDTSGDSYIWVKVPAIPGGSNSGYFWMYYSSDVNSGTEDPSSLWSSNYRGVWHLGESGASYKDSSPFSNNGTGGTNGQTDPSREAGVIGDAQNMSLNTDSIAVSERGSINDLGPVTYSFWIYNSGPTGDRLLSKDKFEFWVPLNTRLRVDISYTGGLLQSEFNCLPGTVWTYIAVTWDGTMDETKILAYQDGTASVSVSSSNTSGSRESDALSDLFIGNDTFFAASNSKDCILDEFRIAGTVRSADWISAQYLSQTDAYLTYSPAEDL